MSYSNPSSNADTRRLSVGSRQRLGLVLALLVVIFALVAAIVMTQVGEATSVAIGDETPQSTTPTPVATSEPSEAPGQTEQPDAAPTPETPDAAPTPETPDAAPTPQPHVTPTATAPTPAPTPTAEVEDPAEPDAPAEDFPPGSEPPEVDLPGGPAPLPEGPPDPPPPPPAPEEPPPPPPPPGGDLEPLPPPAADPEPEPEPDPPTDIPPLEGSGGLTGNKPGCKSRCITTARLYPNVQNPHLQLEVVTKVATKKWVWVLPAGPMNGTNGLPVHLGQVPRFVQSDASKTWSVELLGLQHDRSYRIVLVVEDFQGNDETASTLVTTTSPAPDELKTPGSPCQLTCITAGVATPSSDFGRATIVVESNASVTFDVAISTSPPSAAAGETTLTLPADVTLTDVVAGPTRYEAQAIGMAPETTYHVLASAVDQQGNMQQATGTFTTAAAPAVPTPQPLPDADQNVLMWVERFYIHETGDLAGQGEIGFVWGIRDYGEQDIHETWSQNPMKLDKGQSTTAGGSRTVSVHPGGWLPPVIFNAGDVDWTCANDCTVSDHLCADDPIQAESGIGCIPTDQSGNSYRMYNTAARLDPMRLSDVAGLPTCDNYGLKGAFAEARCVVVQSDFPDDPDAVVYDALVAILPSGEL